MDTIRHFVRSQLGEFFILAFLSIVGAGFTAYMAVHDLKQEVPAQADRITKIESQHLELANTVTELRITLAQLLISNQQLTREVQNLREDIRNR